MKKLLFMLITLLSLTATVQAEELVKLEERIVELPSVVYTPSAFSVFSLPTIEDEFYSLFEGAIAEACVDNVAKTAPIIDVSKYKLPISSNENTVVVDADGRKISFKTVIDTLCSAVYNHPEIGNLTTSYSTYYLTNNPNYIAKIAIGIREEFNQNTFNLMHTNIEKNVYLQYSHNQEKYLNSIGYAYSKAVAPEMNTLEKLLSIHDYLAETVYYPSLYIQAGSQEEIAFTTATKMLVFTPYGALVDDQTAVCQGISLAFKLLCDMAGIECSYAVSDEYNHMWNIVEYNGNYYHIDVTHDNPVVAFDGTFEGRCNEPHICHDHFMRTDEYMMEKYNGKIVWSTKMPECTDDTVYNTFLNGTLNTIKAPLYWNDDCFWYEEEEHRNGQHVSTGAYFKVDDSGKTNVDWDEYAPDKKIEAVIYNSQNATSVGNTYVAIDGAPNTTAQLYAAQYSGNTLVDVELIDVDFDEYGEAVTYFPITTNKLMLFANGTITPIAYAK